MKKALISFLAVVLFAGVSFAGGEWYARSEFDRRITAALERAQAAAGLEVAGLVVDRGSGLLLPQLMGGSLAQVSAHADSVSYNGLELVNVQGQATTVSTSAPITLASMRASAEITQGQLQALAYQYQLPEQVELLLEDGQVFLQAELFGHLLRAGTTLHPNGQEIDLSVTEISMGGIDVDLDSWGIDLVAFFGAPTVKLSQLPPGVRLESIEVTRSESGAHVLLLTLAGSNVTLPEFNN